MKKIIVMSIVASLTFAAQVTKEASINLEQKSNELHMVLDSDKSVYGIQFDVKYDPAKIKLTEDKINHMFAGSDSRANMSVYSKVKEPGVARVIMFFKKERVCGWRIGVRRATYPPMECPTIVID